MIEKIFGYDWQNHVYFQEINDFLPKFVIDTHTHGSPPTKLINMINERALTPGESFNYFPIELYINIFKKIVPGIKYHQVIFGFPHTIGREEETNKYLAKKSLKLINFRPVAIYAPEAPPTKKYLSDFCGLKMYRPLDRPKNEVKIIDFFSEKTLKIINELEKSIVIHLPENLLQNINELMILSEKYKKIKFILAHMGVMYLNSPNYYPAALKEISKRPNIYLDTAMVSDPEVFINALKYLGYKKILFGSDAPFSFLNSNFCLDEKGKLRLRTDEIFPWVKAGYEKEREMWPKNFFHYQIILALKQAINDFCKSNKASIIKQSIFSQNALDVLY